MKIKINGTLEEIREGETLADTLTRMSIPASQVAVAVNREFVARSNHGSTALSEGDEVEILAPHQGG